MIVIYIQNHILTYSNVYILQSQIAVMITNVRAIWYIKITSVNICNYLESLSYSATMNKEKQGSSNPPKRARIAYLRPGVQKTEKIARICH